MVSPDACPPFLFWCPCLIIWCIKSHTKLSNVLLQCLVRFLMHQTLVLDLSIKFWTRTKINFCYWISHSETMFKTIWTGPKTFWTYRRRKHHTLLGSQSEWPKDQILFILGWYKFLVCLECISKNGLSFGHSDWRPSSVISQFHRKIRP